jgi:hypothetical protein
MMALQGHVRDFAVFGDDYDTPDGTAIRDYIHVTDLAAAHLLALKLLMQGHSGGAFNLGTGTGFSVREILAAITAETGREVPHIIKPRRSGDPTYLVADPTAARETLQFRTTHSDLMTIIRTAWAWHRKAHPLQTSELLEPARACLQPRKPSVVLMHRRSGMGAPPRVLRLAQIVLPLRCAQARLRRMRACALHHGNETG